MQALCIGRWFSLIQWISNWAQGIVIAVIISTIVEMVLPNRNIKKYIRTVMGIYIAFIIISPFFTKIPGQKVKISFAEMENTSHFNSYSIDTNSYIETTYINSMKDKIINTIQENGYKVSNIEIIIDKTDENYGNVNEIHLEISKNKTKKNVINKVEINISRNISNTEEIQENEKQSLKDLLYKTYNAQIIMINER